MEAKAPGTGKKCMNPEVDCPNVADPASGYLLFYRGRLLILCKVCGPRVQYQKITEEKSG